MIPDGSAKYNDLVDVVIQSAQVTEDVRQTDGSVIKQSRTDEEILWWKTNEVNSNKFGRFALELKEWERMAQEVFGYMTYDRALVISRQIMAVAISFRRSIDAKSSESVRDKYNSKSTLVDKLGRNRVEKVFTQKGDVKNSLFNSFIGKKKQDEYDDDD